jgi:glycosidase
VRRFVIATISLLVAIIACDSAPSAPASPFPIASCDLALWYKPASELSHVEVVTSWENWQTGLHVLDAQDGGWSATRITPPAGEQEYAFIADGVWVADPYVGTTAFHDGIEVTWIDQRDCTMPSLAVTSPSTLQFTAASDGAPLDASSVSVAAIDGDALSPSITTSANGIVTLAYAGSSSGKHVLAVTASDARGRTTSPARVTVWNEPRAWDWRDALIYQVVVDRYRNAQGALAPPNPVSAFAGGTVAGLTQNLDAIHARGFNAIWVSPLYENPQGTFLGTDGRPYSAYHGYWPSAPRAIDSRFGSEDDVDALIAAAHARDMRIIFDVVPHHVHQEHPYVTAHGGDGTTWFTDWDQDCICGIGSCDWNDHMQDCWFDSYLPSLDFETLDVADQVTSDVAWWIDRFDADGLRIDAVPMMPRAENRRIVDIVHRSFDHPSQKTYLLGENFVAAGQYDLLRYDLGPFGLDGEFDFPTMWTLRAVIAQEGGAMGDIDANERAAESSWAGSGAVMARMIGNHDVTRFSSVSNGDADGDGWTPAVQATDPLVYAKQRMALAIAYTLPGATVVYYGDEIGLAGRQDPDSRRVLPDDSTLSPDQLATRAFTTTLGALRSCSDALRRGTYRALVTDDEALAYAREDAAQNDSAIVVVARNVTAPVTLPMQGMTKGAWVDALGSGLQFDASSPTITMPQHASAIFVPAASACRP